MSKNLDTFDEIDSELKRLKLKSQIDKEELKISFYQLKQSASPGNLFGGVATGIISSGLALKLLAPLATFAIGKIAQKKEHKEKVKKRWWPFG